MPAFGCNQYALPFVMGIFDKEVLVSGGGVDEEGNEIPPVYASIGFRLSDRIVSAVDRFVGSIIGRLSGVKSASYNPSGYGWGRWLFMYLFVGGVDWTHAIDITGNYPLTFTGAITHNQNGITFGSGGSANTGCDVGNVSGNPKAWNRRAQGFYLRTNNAVVERNLNAAMLYPANGYTYFQGIWPRHSDGNAYSDFVSASHPTSPAIYNRVQVAIASSHGFSVQSRIAASDHRMYRNSAQIGPTDTTGEIGMGNGTNSAMLILTSSSRNFSFLFSTKHTLALSVTEVGWLYFFVQQLQTALQRNV